MISLIAALAMAASPATTCKEAKPGLQSKATVTCDVARHSALERVKDNKHASIRSAELEEESGRLVYSFDISRRGHAGVEEVQVDARSGAVVSVKHESARAEAKEKD